jgi:methylphosphotriester-DNA--protein-cysteine methyltransferase
MYEFVDERTDLSSVLGKEVKFFSEQIQEASTHAERLALLENFLLSRLCKQGVTFDRVDYAANMIVNKYGIIHVNELVEDAFLCRRQFERKFLYKIGVSPKYYARIRRVSFLCATLATSKWQIKDWHNFIHQAGYYDQAHFIKDFTEFIGRSPAIYVKHNVELAHYFK